MRTHVSRTLSVVALVVSMAAVAAAQPGPGCHAAGDWAYTKTGTLIPPTGQAPYAAVGKFTLQADGSVSGFQYSSTGGAVAKNVLSGSSALDADCSGTATIEVYDETGTTLLRTAVMAIVFDDSTRELRGIVTRLTLPNGFVVPQAITVAGRRVDNNHGRR